MVYFINQGLDKDMKQKTDYKWLLAIVAVFVLAILLADPIKSFIQRQIKKQSLRTFYTQLSRAENQKQWSTLYDFLPNSTRRFVSRDQYVRSQSSNPNIPYSSQTVVNRMEINGDNGTVNRTKTMCRTSDCTGNNKTVDTSDKIYIYKNGKWSMLENEPSEKALSIAYFMYANSGSKTNQQNAINKWSNYGVVTADYAVHNFALSLDNDSSEMVKAENWVEEYKANQNKSVVIQRQIPLPEFNPPRLQIKQPQQTNCYPNGIGGFNCTTY